MKLLLICLLFVCAARPGSCNFPRTDTYEFGYLTGSITYSLSGNIHHKLKTTFPVVVTECQTLKYVRVDVTHPHEAPIVDFDFATRMVTIQYNYFQSKASTFRLTARTVRDPYCASGQSQTLSVPITSSS